MPNRIVLSWTVNVAGTPFGAAQAATALAGVPLYVDTTTDPVLGQLFGLTVASDVTAAGAGNATRTLTLNMTSDPVVVPPYSPPPFPAHPSTARPPTLPYPLRKAVALAGDFFPLTGSAVVATTKTQVPALPGGATIEFLSQLGVYYTVLAVGPTSITLTAAFTGISASTAAVRIVPAPVTRAALYSTSPLDTAGFATVPAIPAGSGAQSVTLSYLDSTGAGPFTVTVPLTGRRPAQVTIAGQDIATVSAMRVNAVGVFKSSVGQITLSSLSDVIPTPLLDATPRDFLGALTDEAQLLLQDALVYLPPSFFALTQQGASAPQLAGDFFVTTGSTSVATSEDQTAALATGNTIEFASQTGVIYIVQSVGPAYVVLTSEYTGFNFNLKDANTNKRPNDLTAVANKQPTGAFRITPSPAAPPSNAQLAAALAQYINPGNAVPPPSPPLPGTMTPAPTFLSSLFTQTLQLALAVPVVPGVITFS